MYLGRKPSKIKCVVEPFDPPRARLKPRPGFENDKFVYDMKSVIYCDSRKDDFIYSYGEIKLLYDYPCFIQVELQRSGEGMWNIEEKRIWNGSGFTGASMYMLNKVNRGFTYRTYVRAAVLHPKTGAPIKFIERKSRNLWYPW